MCLKGQKFNIVERISFISIVEVEKRLIDMIFLIDKFKRESMISKEKPTISPVSESMIWE